MRDRDAGRSKVYAGEHRVRFMLDQVRTADSPPAVKIAGSTLTLPRERMFASLESIQAYCDRVCDLCGISPVRVRERKGDSFAHYETGGIIAVCTTQNRWAMREIVILHELAHHMHPYEGHGSIWRASFLDLVNEMMAPEVGLALQFSWYEEGLR